MVRFTFGILFMIACLALAACGDDSSGDTDGGTETSCTDGVQNGSETDVDCGGSTCDPCGTGDACEMPEDCESLNCVENACVAAACGDGIVHEGEDCDDEGESATCNADCSTAVCGDGVVNATAGEECEPEGDAVWQRCGGPCVWGAGLDGTFGDTWETLAAPSGRLGALQSFHYSGMPYIYDFYNNSRYDIDANSWSSNEEETPFSNEYWANAAVERDRLWVARDESMFVFSLATETWDTAGTSIPDGSDEEGAAVFDSDGFIWYHGSSDSLVRYDPSDWSTATFTHSDYAGFDVYETRIAFDPISRKLVFTGYGNDTFLIFDLATEEFSAGSASPGGAVRDNTCQDRSGGIYAGSDLDPTKMYRYDIAADSWTVLPDLPTAHDNNSTCVVSQDGYLYYPTDEGGPDEFYRLPLGKR